MPAIRMRLARPAGEPSAERNRRIHHGCESSGKDTGAETAGSREFIFAPLRLCVSLLPARKSHAEAQRRREEASYSPPPDLAASFSRGPMAKTWSLFAI